MGFRLWVNDDICLGKLYGYTEDSQHLYSIDWLVNHGFFDEDRKWWVEELYPTLYDVAIAEFDCSYRLEIKLKYDEFIEFYLIYLADMIERWRNSDCKFMISDLQDWVKQLDKLPKDKSVNLHWF